MKKTSSVWLGLLALPAIANAHHAFRAIYDFSRTVEIQGSIVSLELVNPHAFLHIDVADEAGTTSRWVVEGPGKLSLARRGWTDDMFEPGETLTVVGNPSNVADREIWLEKIVRADGTEVIDPLVADELAIEEDRRLRIERLQQRETAE
jgi:DNA/RNA endonuclease YhcR with UshA esterase domain